MVSQLPAPSMEGEFTQGTIHRSKKSPLGGLGACVRVNPINQQLIINNNSPITNQPITYLNAFPKIPITPRIKLALVSTLISGFCLVCFRVVDLVAFFLSSAAFSFISS